MKRPMAWCAAAAVAALFACSSGNGSNSFPFSGPSCPASSQITSCFDCYEQSCNGSCLTSACADFFSCFCACNPGDQSCLNGCIPKAETQQCTQCAANVNQASCQQSCSSQCSSSSMGGSSSGFGSSSGSSGGGGTVYCAEPDGSICIATSGVSSFTCPSSTTSVVSCPSGNELGSCAITATGSSATVTEYYYCAGALSTSGASASTYQSACTSANGRWSAGSITQCPDAGGTGSSSGGGSGSSSGGPTDGGGAICHAVPCGTMGQSMQYCEYDDGEGGACTQAWYQVGSQVFDCTSCTTSGCMAAEQSASMACP